MSKTSAEPQRDIDFSAARRGAVVPPAAGKTKISIRIDTAVLDHFRRLADAAGGGSYQTLINDTLVAWIQRESMLAATKRAVREELVRYEVKPKTVAASPSRRGRSA
ncbi:MAG: BrnA antitoxin family protein [Betaproteobacteria bacterium]